MSILFCDRNAAGRGGANLAAGRGGANLAAGRGGADLRLGRTAVAIALGAGVLAGCGWSSGQVGDATGQYRQCLKRSHEVYRSSGDFDRYIRKVKEIGRACGIGGSTLDAALDDVRAGKVAGGKIAIKQQMAAADGASGMLTARRRGGNAVRDYLNLRITPEFVARGREMMARHQEILQDVEAKYGVPAHYIVGYWGIETNYGAVTGRHAVVPTLARLGYRSSRRRFFSSELIGALLILDRGYARRSMMYGSFAGAMGQPQFMPSSYIYFAVDHNGDGRRDIWRTPADIFASIANYNIERGKWDTEIPSAIYGVRLPRNLRLTETGFYNARALNDWRRAGVKGVGGRSLPDSEAAASIYMPAGCGGPVFLISGNFWAIMRYNNLIEYAFAVSVLAEKIKGDFRIRKSWPRNDFALTRWERAALQRRLTRKGYGRLKPDGILGRKSRIAIQKYQKRKGLCPSGHVNTRLYRHIMRGGGRGYADNTRRAADQRAELRVR